MRLSFTERADQSTHPLGKRLLKLMEEKQSNLAFNPDVTKSEDFLRLADEVGPEICVLKTHIDILEDFHPDVIKRLQDLADRHNFVIFEDRKFADIGNTVKLQYEAGIYRIAEWADMVNAHGLPGPGIIEGLKAVGLSRGRGLLLLAQMSSSGNLLEKSYRDAMLHMAREHPDFVLGFIAMEKICDEPYFIHFTPGVQLQKGGDSFGQQYMTPDYVIGEKESDIIIVGRGIFKAECPKRAAAAYRDAAWQAYVKSLRKKTVMA